MKAARRSPPSWWPTAGARRRRPRRVRRSARGPGAGIFRHSGRSSQRRAGLHQVVPKPEARQPGLRLAGRRKRQTGTGLRQHARRRNLHHRQAPQKRHRNPRRQHHRRRRRQKRPDGRRHDHHRRHHHRGLPHPPRQRRGNEIYIAATHAVFAPPAMERLAKAHFTKLAVTDTIPVGNRCQAIKDRLVVLSVAELLGEAIHRIHNNQSVSAPCSDPRRRSEHR